jgi:hypothetical protein
MPPSRRRTAEDGTVTLTLAHPLSGKQAYRLGHGDSEDQADLNVGDEIKVRDAAHARAVISSGYAAVDPEDPEAVEKALGGPAPGTVVDPDEKPDHEPITSPGGQPDPDSSATKTAKKS